MKLQSITIQNMHQVDGITYKFSDIAYLVGPNGAGKSTVLEAIQLALLGYIPGYAKTNESIMKHSNGLMLSVTAILDNRGQTIQIVRTWQGTSSVKGTVSIDPEGFSISDILANIELPIFNFGEFKDMTANRLKQWFIDFLPSASAEINWEQEFNDALGDRCIHDVAYNDIFEEVMTYIADSELTGVEQVKFVNEKCKELQTFYKGQMANLDGTIQSLVYYDDCEAIDEDEVNSAIRALNDVKSNIVKADQLSLSKTKYEHDLAELKDQLSRLGDMDVVASTAKLAELESKLNELRTQEKQYADSINAQNLIMQSRSLATQSTCPYTSEKCEKLEAISEKNKQEREKAESAIKELKAKWNEVGVAKDALSQEYFNIKKNLEVQSVAVTNLGVLNSRISDINEELATIYIPCDDKGNKRTLQDIDLEIIELNQQLGKIAANKRYLQLKDTITKDKFIAESKIEILKKWIKHTDANGLQNTLMQKPFEELADNITNYLSAVFADEVQAKFNLVSKANSFSFGLVNQHNEFIAYDYLSSGERCLYTLAMMMCLIDMSDCPLKLIMADDMFDHLDDNNANKVFDALIKASKSSNIQFILAGVKPCNKTNICVEVK